MGSEPLFSVVIPTYNRGHLILKTLHTVFSQTYQNYEIIVVDNCSTDDTQKVLEPYVSAGKVKLIKHERNYERARARNTGMDNAAGDFLTFLDSDDLMYPSNLEDAARYVKAHPETKFFHSLYQLVDADNNVLCNFNFPSLADPHWAITGGNFLACIGDFIHRDLYRSYRFDTDSIMIGTEDWDLWLRIVADYAPGRIDKINNGIVQHGDRGVNTLDLGKMRQRYSHLAAKISNDPHLDSVYGKYLKRLEAGSLLYTATVANLACRHTEALKCLLLASAKDFQLACSINFAKALGIALLRLDKGY